MAAPSRTPHLVLIALSFAASVAVGLGLFGPYLTYEGQPPSQQIEILFLLPVTASVVVLLLGSLQRRRISPNGDAASADRALNAIVFWAVAFLTGVHTLVLAVLVDAQAVEPIAKRGVVVLLGITLMLVGNLLPRTRPNVAIGLRTERTLNDRGLWITMHRVSGYVLVVVGAFTVVSGIALAGEQVAALPAAAAALGSLGIAVAYARMTRRVTPASHL